MKIGRVLRDRKGVIYIFIGYDYPYYLFRQANSIYGVNYSAKKPQTILRNFPSLTRET